MKKRDRRTKPDSRGEKQDSRVVRQGSRRGKRVGAGEGATGAAARHERERAKRSGVEAVKLHLQVTGGTGRTSRSATTMETRSKTKANLTATEVGRVQRERRERSPRGARPGSAATTDGASALLDGSSTHIVGTDLHGEAQPGPALDRPSARTSSPNVANAKTSAKNNNVHSKLSFSERSRSSRSSATIRAQKLALEADVIRRQVDRERAQMERERKQAELEREAEQAELQAKLAAMDASDKSTKSRSWCCTSRNTEKRTASWVSEQNANITRVTHTNMPGEALIDTLSNPQGLFSQPAAPANTVSYLIPDVNRTTHSKPIQRSASDPIKELTHAINALSNRPKKLELVSFSGDVGQWMAFKSSYERTKSNFSPSENLDRLNNAVRGPAYQSVASLLWISGDPDDIMNTLEQTYARPELLVAREVAELRKSPKLSCPEDLNNLANKLRNFVITLKLLKQNEYLSSPELFRCVLIKLSEHTRARFTDFASVHVPEEQFITKLELLSRFLLNEADKQLKYNFVTDGTVKTPTPIHSSKSNFRKETVHATVSNDKTPECCTYCKQGPHSIKTCKRFLLLTIDDRWRWVRESKVCYRCLKSNPHTWNNCRAKRCGVDGCSRRHNALLHGTETASPNANAALSSKCDQTQTSPASASGLGHSNDTDNKTEPVVKITNTSDLQINVTGRLPSASRPRGLLKVVPIILEGPDGEFETTALLDEGSTATLIDGEVAARIGVKPSCQERLRIEGVSGMTKEVEVSYVDFYIRGRNRPDRYLVKHARAIKPLGLRAQNPDLVHFTAYDHLSDLSDELSYPDTLPTVLIGAPDWHLSLSREVRCGKKNEPVASRTLLGWVLHGALSVSSKPLDFVNHVSDDLDALIKSQYDIDALGITKNTPCPTDDDRRAVEIVESSARQLDDGHFEVGLPWKKNLPKIIPDSYPQALSRFKALERQMSKDSEFAAAFQKFIEDIISKGYAEECDPSTYHQRLPTNASCVNKDRSDVLDVQLHVVADGGEQAYACVAYWRFSYSDGFISTALIGSKARVFPLKPVSIPRLELQAAVIASRFAQTILQAHRFRPSETIFWTDSTTVLKWIRSDARSFKPFVAHRLGEILETTNPSSWRWIPTSLNVADDATKPKRINFTSSHRWFTGPQFLTEPPCTWPTECIADVEEIAPDSELKSDLVVLLLDTLSSCLVPDPSRFSSWLRLLRATARVLQGARLFRLKLSRPIDSNSKLFIDSTTSPYQLHATDIVEAEKMVVHRAQTDSFPDELTALRFSKPVPKNSRIAKLAPMLDKDGLLRLDTRIRSAPAVNENVKSPTILDGRHHAVRLLIFHEHIKAAHHFNELVLNELRQRFWILRARGSIRSVAHACLLCRKWKCQPAQPQTGNLPPERLDHHKRPFTHVGLDYFGPVMVKIYRRQEKRYVALYTCLVTRALHLEIVTSLSSDAAIMSLRRFIARRGSPSTIFSDNGTNFVGASRELRCLHDDCVQEYATNHKIDRRFIPPASPFMGGAWERLVRTVKSALKSCLANQPLQEDVLATLLLEAEAIVNSRPLTYISSSPDSPEAITPFHFILGTSSVEPWTSSLTDADLIRRCDWRRTLRLADHFWARWLREYLPTLRPRGPTTNASNLGEGDVVLIADPSLPRGLWPLGRIVKTYLGPDGAVRVADVHTKGGMLRRPARKLLLMEAAPQPVTTGC